MEEWNQEKYESLLSSSMFKKKKESIRNSIQICEENGIEDFSKCASLIYQITPKELQAKRNFLKATGRDIIDENGKVNHIFTMLNKNMQNLYGISKKEIINQYYEMPKVIEKK